MKSIKDKIAKLIDSILGDIIPSEYIVENENFDIKDNKKVYRDQPILTTANNIKQSVNTQYNILIKKMLQIEPIINKPYYSRTEYLSHKFYLQGKFMEEAEDNYDYEFNRKIYSPTYIDYSIDELRGYFSFRTKVRKGELNKVAASYVFIYIYELINQIGVKNPLEGFEKLLDFWIKYRLIDNCIDRYMTVWLRDYLIYYNLDFSRNLEFPIIDINLTNKIDMLYKSIRAGNKSKVVKILGSYSSYKIFNSKFYKEYPIDYENVFYIVYNKLTEFQQKNRKTSLLERIFGNKSKLKWRPFSNAVFYYNTDHTKDMEYIINNFEKYIFENANITQETYFEHNVDRRYIGEIFQLVDSIMRKYYNYKNHIMMPKSSNIMVEIVTEVVYNYCIENDKSEYSKKDKQKKSKNEEVKKDYIKKDIVINTKKFDDIRKISKITQEKLIIEAIEEKNKENVYKENTKKEDEIDRTTNTENFIEILENLEPLELMLHSLLDFERQIIVLLLQNRAEEIFEIAKKSNMMVSVILEQINEKALEYINDNLIDTANTPFIYEDYFEELIKIIR